MMVSDKLSRILLTALSVLFAMTNMAKSEQQNLQTISLATYEKIYVPAYSYVLTHENRKQPLASTMVIHNTDSVQSIRIMRVDFHDHSGTLEKAFLDVPITISPYESRNFLVPINDQSGGFGSNYLVEWESINPATSPVVEAVMIGGSGSLGISFTSSGRVIERR